MRSNISRTENHREMFRTASGFIIVRYGSEGPRHDPYSYSKITCQRGDHTACIHIGLGVWLEIDNKRISLANPNPFNGNVPVDDNDIILQFEEFMGCSLKALDKAIERIHSTCRQCGGRADEEVNGYPGETLTICENGHVMGSSFCEAAVI